MVNWNLIDMVAYILPRVPVERLFIHGPNPDKDHQELAGILRGVEASHSPPLSPPPTLTMESPEEVAQGGSQGMVEHAEFDLETIARDDIATACVPCAVGHFAGAAKLLNEAFRFRDDGITSNQVIDDIAGAIGELNAMERIDLTPEKLQNTSTTWERPIADEALRESRKLRHRLEDIGTMEELEEAAANAESYYKRLNRQWYKGRFAHLGKEKVETIESRISPEDK